MRDGFPTIENTESEYQDFSEKTGRGVPKITEKYGKEAFEFRENAIVVKIPFNWINVMGDKNINSRILNETQSRILEEIRNNPNITKKKIQEKIGKGKTTVDNGITYLREKFLKKQENEHDEHQRNRTHTSR